MDPAGIGDSQALLQLLIKYPLPNDPTQGDGLNSTGYRLPYTIHRTYNTHISRIDWNVTPNGKHTLFWHGDLQNDTEPNPPAFPGQPPSMTTLTNSMGFAADYTWLISSNLVNNLHYGLTRQGVENAGVSNQPEIFSPR